ncbi:MBL fold metallo-hydrolase [Algoriphagus algorifonticola]|uniref:MBL fold metallo-hydrolase n=1 Tax=Algoriphagus algorifonticola TaxID=2593007 RepID=UPI0011A4B979|nr:MBL fold metallo-hydrolase [Algoriphagus algorifonticola]
MLKIKRFTFNPFQENTYIIYDEKGSAAIIDPGCYEPEEKKELYDFIIQENLKPELLLNTHCHVDHVLGNEWVEQTYSIPLLIHENEIPVLNSAKVLAPNYGFPAYRGIEPDGYMSPGKEISVGQEELQVLFVPGHAPGHVVFYHPTSKICIAGDTLFRGSIGRTDLPGGDHDLLLEKIKSELFSLPEDTTVYPGHGPETSIEFEKIYNPFVGKNASY